MIQYVSEINCLECGMRTEEPMPATSCQVFHQCRHCGAIMQPRSGDCCVFCSHGSVPCPPVQRDGGRSTDGEPTM